MNEQRIAIWPNHDWCYYEEIEEMTHKSDDYLICNVPEDWTFEEIEEFVGRSF